MDGRLATGLVPEFLEDQRRAPMAGADDGEMMLAMFGEDQQFVREACTGAEQAVDLTVLLEFVESAQSGQDGLLRAAVAPVVLDDLEVGAWAGLFGAEEQGDLRIEPLGV